MHVHVALSPAEFAGAPLERRTALVVDVIRASTTVVAACAAGCRRIVPVRDRAAALRAADALGATGVLLAGERHGETIAGFDLGNSPLEYTADRVSGRTVVLTTTNGTAAMLEAQRAAGARGGRLDQPRGGGALGGGARAATSPCCAPVKAVSCPWRMRCAPASSSRPWPARDAR